MTEETPTGVAPLTKTAAERPLLERISLVASISPWLATLALALSGLYVRLAFGRWPRVYLDSPESPFITAAAIVAMLTALSCPVMGILALVLPLVRLGFRMRPLVDGRVVSSCIGAGVLYVLCTIDPFGFLEWAFD